MPSVAVIVIGNEILTGKFADENGPYLIRRLRDLGADLHRLVTLSDDVDGIAAEVRACAARYDHVVTTGGVGPTHDDVTFEGIARAFDVALEAHPDLIALAERFELPRNAGTLRMAMVPVGTVLLHHEALSYPVMRMRNVWVFPGVPRLLRNKFEAVANHFAGEAVHTARLYTAEDEWDIAERLTAVAERYPNVAIGSYPRFGEGAYHGILTLESRDPDLLARACAELEAVLTTIQLPPDPRS
jgi:molybdenum cofactor synthesis domain-containing protein